MLGAELIDARGEIHVINWREFWPKLLGDVDWQVGRALTEAERGELVDADVELRWQPRIGESVVVGCFTDCYDSPAR
jgi:hypothetical protein